MKVHLCRKTRTMIVTVLRDQICHCRVCSLVGAQNNEGTVLEWKNGSASIDIKYIIYISAFVIQSE